MKNYKDRVGEVFRLYSGEIVEIIEYFSALNVTIRFKDGVLKHKVTYSCLRDGYVKKPFNRVGEEHINKKGESFTIIEYIDFKNCTVKFQDGTILYNINYGNIKKGALKNPYFPVHYGVGYLGIGKYLACTATGWSATGEIWSGMLKRCSTLYQKKFPTYKGCSVVEEWYNFQNFAKWYEENYNPEYMNGWHLDKDILIKGNKTYSPETCCFVPVEINVLFKSSKKRRGVYPIGITAMDGCKYRVECQRKNRSSYIGRFYSIKEAFQAYKTAKEEYIKEVADKWKDLIDPRVYEALYNYHVDITD